MEVRKLRKARIIQDRVGQKFGRLTILKLISRESPHGKSVYQCLCTCGEIKEVRLGSLLNKSTSSCGCLFKEHMINRNTKHGLMYEHKRTYRTWKDMRQRCNNKNCKDYPNYGGRGIKVCERWNDFKNFYDDMGERPNGMTIDRIDVNGDYEPFNCRWATSKEQARNKRNNHIMENGKTIAENCEIFGVDCKVASYRIKSGYSFNDSMSSKDFRIDKR